MAVQVYGRSLVSKRWSMDILKRAREIREKAAEPVTKLVDGVPLPASSFLVVEDEKRPSTWHLPVLDAEGKPDRRRMGAARAALTVGYRGQKYQGPQKNLALARLQRIYAKLADESETATKPGMSGGLHGPSIKNPKVYEGLLKRGMSKQQAAAISNAMVGKVKKETSLTVFKQADGRYRWVTLSSNAFRDRDRQIVSTKALENDVKRADADKDYGPLRFWHMKIPVRDESGQVTVKGVDIGDCDFNWMKGRTLIESGTFRDDRIGAKVAEKAQNYQVSIGFRHPSDEPDKNGVFHTIRRFERSIVPAGRAANPFTSLQVHKEQKMNDTQKLAAFKALLEGDESLVSQVLAGATAAEKTADDMGVAFKEYGNMTADELLDYAIARKEAELAEKAAKQKPEMEDEDESGMGAYMTKMDAYTTKMGALCDRMEKMLAGTATKDDSVIAVQEATNAHSARLAEAETRIKELQSQLVQALESVKELQGDLPPGVQNGRATSKDTNIIADAAQVGALAQKEHGTQNALDGFLQFAVGGN